MAGKGLTNLTTSDFESEKLLRSGLWLVDFSAVWCPPCRVLTTLLVPLSAEYAGRLSIGELNTDEQPEVAARFRINSAPTMLLFRDGEAIDRRMGLTPKATLQAWLEGAMSPVESA